MRYRMMCLLFLLAAVVLPAVAAPSHTELSRRADALLAGHYADKDPGIAVLVARGDNVLYRGSRGRANLELGVPLSPDHVFRLASVTKQFAAAGILKLAEEGKLSLDDPLSKFLPGYPGGDGVTVEMLLNHTSGIRSYTDMPGVLEGPIQRDVTTAQLIDTFKNEKPDFAPGEGFHYNNSGYVLAGAVIEAASGMPWHAYLDKVFFTPLGMNHTGYGDPTDAVIPGHVSGYTLKDGRWAPARYLSMSQPQAAGALVSNVGDLLKWNRALHEGKLLSDAHYQQMITATGKAADDGYGYGIVHGNLRGHDMLQHGGGIFGFSTFLLYLPEDDLTVAVLSNADSGKPGAIGSETLARMLAAEAIGKPYPAKKAIATDPGFLEQYEGVYRLNKDATRTLRVVDGKLTSQRTGGRPYTLIPVAKDAFLFEEGFSRMVFERDATGNVTAMRFFQDDEGTGEVVALTDEPLPATREAMTLPREALERVTGDYVRQGVTLKVFLDGDVLKGRLGSQSSHELFAESPSRFFLRVVEAELEFAPDSDVPARVTLHQNGHEMVFERGE